jgi:integrase
MGAKRWRQDAMVAIRNGSMTSDRGPTLNEALDRWIGSLPTEQTRSGDPYKPGTIRGYEMTIRRYGVRHALGHLRVREILTADAQRWIDKMVQEGKLAPATIDTAVTPLKAFYRRALIRGEATVNPFASVMKPAVRCEPKRIVTPVEAAAMISALAGRDKPLWATAFYCGLRRGELIGLRADDIDLAKGLVHVRRGWDMVEGEIEPKSRKGRRSVPIPAALRDHLDELLIQVGEGPLFGTPSWVAKSNERVAKVWSARNLPVLTLHAARHTYASLMIAAGVNAKTLSTFLGHGTVAVTLDRYGKLFPGSEDEAATLLDSYLARSVGASIVAQPVARPADVPC